ncbi:hypothetical protein ISCGN_002425 [Ixodes scapularis]
MCVRNNCLNQRESSKCIFCFYIITVGDQPPVLTASFNVLAIRRPYVACLVVSQRRNGVAACDRLSRGGCDGRMAVANDDAGSQNVMITSCLMGRALQEQGSGCEFLFPFWHFRGEKDSRHTACTLHCITKKSRRAIVGSQATRTGHGTGWRRSGPSERRVANLVGRMCLG